MKKIGIFGGAFNPITKAHMQVAVESMERLELDILYFEPVGNHYEKNGLESAEDRIKMIWLALDRYEDYTIVCGTKDALSAELMYTYQVLEYYSHPYHELYFILGSDNLREIDQWKNPDRIFELSNLIVHQRSGHDVLNIIGESEFLYKYEDQVYVIPSNNSLSSTLVRNWIKSGTHINSRYMDRKVMKYIQENGLYVSN